MLLQPSFQISTTLSPENVTFSRSKRGRDGGSEEGGRCGRQMRELGWGSRGRGGGAAERRQQVLREMRKKKSEGKAVAQR